MPYRNISELPDSVKNHLPKRAQEIYMKVFNNAYEEYADPSKRRPGTSHEESACRVAWSVVKKQYEKNDKGHWVKK
ncbi:MAG: Cation transport regulator ChaB [Candidatus Anoxychlamydiales bacterium]|nr:Cation transport regulator ChaB [Candidatus Anoxychlamydiales bacterium]NGX36641.1 Cation transport regulator ChaB [Candidatus Anoxychlamydiales bacterium]